MKNAHQKRQSYPTAEQLAEQFKNKIEKLRREWPEAHEIAEHLVVRSPQIDKWASEFFKKELPLLKELYLTHKIPPAEIVETVALCKFAPVANNYPVRLRSTRPKDRAAAQFEKAAAVVRLLDSISAPVWGVDVLDQQDIGLEFRLEELANKVRALKPISGRPENRMLRECAQELERIFRKYTKENLRLQMAELLDAAYPDQWILHGRRSSREEKISAVKDLLRQRRQRRARSTPS